MESESGFSFAIASQPFEQIIGKESCSNSEVDEEGEEHCYRQPFLF